LSGSRAALRIVLIAVASAALGAGFVSWSWSAAREAEETSRIGTLIQLRCYAYWSRSGIADASFEFRNGRKALLEIVRATDPALDYWTPGLRAGAVAETRRGPPLPGPDFKGIDYRKIRHRQPWCHNEQIYAWDYNVTMLRLLGRDRDAEMPYASPELSS
jgi:hypothetical protein